METGISALDDHMGLISTIVKSFSRNNYTLKEDLLAESIFVLFLSLEKYDAEKAPLQAFIRLVTVGACNNFIKRNVKHFEEEDVEVAHDFSSLSVKEFIENLGGVEKRITLLLYEGYSIKEVAEQLSLTPLKVYRHIYRIRDKYEANVSNVGNHSQGH